MKKMVHTSNRYSGHPPRYHKYVVLSEEYHQDCKMHKALKNGLCSDCELAKDNGGAINNAKCIYGATIRRLGEYEETGLTPDEILQLKNSLKEVKQATLFADGQPVNTITTYVTT